MFAPLSWLLFLLAATFVVRSAKGKKILLIAAVLIFIIFSNPVLFNWYAGAYQPQPVQLPAESHYSVGILAGGFGSVDKNGNGYFNASSDRFLQTVKLYRQGIIDHILVSGGNSRKNDNQFTEAAWARQEMLAFGIPDSVIFIEDRSANTKENARNSKKILDSLGFKQPYVLVTSAFHMPRAKKNFSSQRMNIIAFPCNYTEGRGPITWRDWIPLPSTLVYWSPYVKEAVATIMN